MPPWSRSLLVAMLLAAANMAETRGKPRAASAIQRKVQKACPAEVAACRADADCKAELARSFSEQAEPAPEAGPSEMVAAIIECFNAASATARQGGDPRGATEDFLALATDQCPAELKVCESAPGDCRQQLIDALSMPSAPADGTPEMMGVIHCMKGAARSRRGDAALDAARERCPEEMSACEGADGCTAELSKQLRSSEPPASDDHPEMMAVIGCLGKLMAESRRQESRQKEKRKGTDGKQGRKTRPSFKEEAEMSSSERQGARLQQVARIGSDVSCELCKLLMDDLTADSMAPSWSHQRGERSSMEAACAAKPPLFAAGYAVHPCTREKVADGRCAERQNYHVQRNNGSADSSLDAEAGMPHGAGMPDEPALAAVYRRSMAEQLEIDLAVFSQLCEEVLKPKQLDWTLEKLPGEFVPDGQKQKLRGSVGERVCERVAGVCDSDSDSDAPAATKKKKKSSKAKKKKKAEREL